MNKLFRNSREAALGMASITDDRINSVLKDLAEETIACSAEILAANQKDLDKMDKDNPLYDRLALNPERLEGIAADMKNVASLPSPVNRILTENNTNSGLHIVRKSVPFGVIGIIYEARPNVTFDVFSLCFKSGNAVVLKGGSDAHNANLYNVSLIKKILKKHHLNEDIVTLLPPERASTGELLNAVGYVDMLIPRGSKGLIDYVRDNARIPVIETGAGIVHTYFDEFGDTEKGEKIVFNAKTRRVSVCNALDCWVIHEKRLSDLPYICNRLKDKNVTIYADPPSHKILKGNYPESLLQEADETAFGTEFLGYKMAIKTVANLQEAITHINQYTSRHSESIITENEENKELFLKMIDAAVVYANTSTAFSDGAQFGLGAEIGISTQKMHARGPMALEELTTYKWIVQSAGATRE